MSTLLEQVENSCSKPKVAILLCTYNGQRFLAEQLDSFEAQTYEIWEVWVSDDGSQDNTLMILESYQQKWPAGRLNIQKGPSKGFVANFLSLVYSTSIEANYFAYSDQDDVWLAEKLERSIKALGSKSINSANLYCGRTVLIDENKKEIGLSPLFLKPPIFANALIQNIGSGNTMVFDQNTRNLLCRARSDFYPVTHDWWTYILVTGAGGKVIFDLKPTVSYRQHQNNQIGMNSSWKSRLKRFQRIRKGCFQEWNKQHIQLLRAISEELKSESIEILEEFEKARNMKLLNSLFQLKKSGVYRQTVKGQLSLYTAAFFGKI